MLCGTCVLATESLCRRCALALPILDRISTDFNSYGPRVIAKTSAHRRNGRLAAPLEPGLGVEPDFEILGKPVFEIGEI